MSLQILHHACLLQLLSQLPNLSRLGLGHRGVQYNLCTVIKDNRLENYDNHLVLLFVFFLKGIDRAHHSSDVWGKVIKV